MPTAYSNPLHFMYPKYKYYAEPSEALKGAFIIYLEGGL